MAGEPGKLAAWWGRQVGLTKSLPFVGLLGAAAVVAPFVLNSFRNNRRYDEDNAPMSEDLTDPLPPVLEYTPPVPATLMGMPPVEGPLAQKIKMQRGGISAGIDTSVPNVLTPAGVSAIDGKHVQDLNSETSTPNFGLPA